MKTKELQKINVSYEIIDATTQIVLNNGIAEIQARNPVCARRKMQNSLHIIVFNRVCAYFIDKYDITKEQFTKLYNDGIINLREYYDYKIEFIY